VATEDPQEKTVGFAYIWEFTVRGERQAEFEDAYGPEGAWAQLFKRHPGYRGTELLRDNSDPLRYWTLDHWDSERSQRAFHRDFSTDFEELDRRCEALTRTERFLGEFNLIGVGGNQAPNRYPFRA
jgi:heme-degrading monooxygenase HmoA